MTQTQTQPKFSAELWAAFWAAPDVARAGDVLADDIVGYWQGVPEPVRGKTGLRRQDRRTRRGRAGSRAGARRLCDRRRRRTRRTAGVPALRAGGPDGPVAIRGLDRVRARDGVVVENVIRYDFVDPASV